MSLNQLTELEDWEAAQKYCEEHADEVAAVDPLTGGTVLHRLCTKPQAPIGLLQTVVALFPDAVRIQERVYSATPLHIISWTSQRTTGKVQVLLHHMLPNDLQLKNRFGGTVLHSACGSQASIQVIKLMVQKNPSIIAERTYEYNHTALTALWHSHLQSIQGHMQIARILEGEEVDDGHFDRFWEKVEFLARESFKQSPACPDMVDPDSSDYALHGLLQLRAPLNMLKVAIKRHPEWVSIPDRGGNYPLHHVVRIRPFRIKDIELIEGLVVANAEVAAEKNDCGDTPIFIGIRDRMVWEEGLGDIVRASTEVLGTTDPQTGLYPFLLAASLGGKVAVNTTYHLLCAKPDLI